MPTWPASLPQRPLRDSFRASPNTDVIGFKTEVGPGKMRRRSTARTTSYQMTFHLDVSKIATFETFFQDTILDGSLSFTFPDPITQTSITVRFDPETKPPYTLENVGGALWRLSMTLVKLP